MYMMYYTLTHGQVYGVNELCTCYMLQTYTTLEHADKPSRSPFCRVFHSHAEFSMNSLKMQVISFFLPRLGKR